MNERVLGTGVGGLIIFLNIDRALSCSASIPSIGLALRVVVVRRWRRDRRLAPTSETARGGHRRRGSQPA